jgi:hypothetical protein
MGRMNHLLVPMLPRKLGQRVCFPMRNRAIFAILGPCEGSVSG